MKPSATPTKKNENYRKKTFKQEKWKKMRKARCFLLGLIIVIILIGYYAHAFILCIHMSTEVQRKAASGDIRKTQWGVVPVAAS